MHEERGSITARPARADCHFLVRAGGAQAGVLGDPGTEKNKGLFMGLFRGRSNSKWTE
jgi:hypothetical protein